MLEVRTDFEPGEVDGSIDIKMPVEMNSVNLGKLYRLKKALYDRPQARGYGTIDSVR